MKRLATLLLVALLLPLVACADSLMSVSDLRDQVEASGGRWTQTYTSVRGETISVDVVLNVPDVETFPVLRTSWFSALPDEFLNDYGVDENGQKPKYARWYALNDRYGYIVVNHDWDFVLGYGESGSGKHFEYPGRMLPHDNLDWSRPYAFANDLPIDEAFGFMKQVVGRCYTRYGMAFYEPDLRYILLEDPPLCEGVQIREKGAYTFQCYEDMHGIPMLQIVGQGCNTITPFYTFRIISQNSYSFNCKLHRELELLIDDVPLLSFDKIKPAFEEMIRDGRLRDVYEVRLGYLAVYEEGKMENEVFRLIPCWMLSAEYYKSSKVESTVWDEDEWGSPIYPNLGTTERIVINAQTGKVIDQNASNKENKKLFSVKTW